MNNQRSIVLSKIINKIIITSIIIFASNACFARGDYPKTKLDREMEEIGSLLDGGIVFKPSKERSRETQSTIGNVNKYLFRAAIDVLSFAPLASADSTAGVVITDWHSLNKEKSTQIKVIAFIRDDIISTEGLEVVAFERKKTGDQWSEATKKTSLARSLEDKILRKARNLYLKDLSSGEK